MLKYLVVLLDDSSVSYCSYASNVVNKRICESDLKAGVVFAMKHNLHIQYVYPDYEMPDSHKKIIESTTHTKISSIRVIDINSDIYVIDNCKSLLNLENIITDAIYVLRLQKADLFNHYQRLEEILRRARRLNVIITDIETFNQEDFFKYENVLRALSSMLLRIYKDGMHPQLNILTDRVVLHTMNNCNAGCESVVLAPNGKFYVCPAFYYDNEENFIGTPYLQVNIRNKHLYEYNYAPICKKCDAYHCRRCVFLNSKTTLEVNTPSHEQCVASHLERNVSVELLSELKTFDMSFADIQIEYTSYLDPIDLINKEN